VLHLNPAAFRLSGAAGTSAAGACELARSAPCALYMDAWMRPSIAGGRRRTTRPAGVVRIKEQVLAVVAAIPEGRVTTYGAIARHLRVTARQVAFVLARLTEAESEGLPWFRVVAAKGVVSSTKLGAVGRRQIERLRAEGVSVTPRNKVEVFDSICWSPGRLARRRVTKRGYSRLSVIPSNLAPFPLWRRGHASDHFPR
jgi:methylated-DNA-protein-cysteine methyltransferase related protein